MLRQNGKPLKAAYRASPKGKVTRKARRAMPERRAARKAYNATPERRAYQRAYSAAAYRRKSEGNGFLEIAQPSTTSYAVLEGNEGARRTAP